MRKRDLLPVDTLSAYLSAAAAVEYFTLRLKPKNTVTATGAAIRPTIGGSENTAKCDVRIWSVSAAAKNSRPNVQMPAIAAMPVGKRIIGNVLRMLQVLKMSTWVSVTRPLNEALSPSWMRDNGSSSTCYDYPSGQIDHLNSCNANERTVCLWENTLLAIRCGQIGTTARRSMK